MHNSSEVFNDKAHMGCYLVDYFIPRQKNKAKNMKDKAKEVGKSCMTMLYPVSVGSH